MTCDPVMGVNLIPRIVNMEEHTQPDQLDEEEEELMNLPEDKIDSSVPDENGKPALSYIALITRAIESTPLKMATLGEICEFICESYSYYKARYPSWQNSIRHNLSLNDCFVKVARTPSTPGKGNFWKLDPLAANMFENGSLLRRRKRYKRPTAHFFGAQYLHALSLMGAAPNFYANGGSPYALPPRHVHVPHYHPYRSPNMLPLSHFHNPYTQAMVPPFHRPLVDIAQNPLLSMDSQVPLMPHSAAMTRLPLPPNMPLICPPHPPADTQRPMSSPESSALGSKSAHTKSPSPHRKSPSPHRKSPSPILDVAGSTRKSPSPINYNTLESPSRCGPSSSPTDYRDSVSPINLHKSLSPVNNVSNKFNISADRSSLLKHANFDVKKSVIKSNSSFSIDSILNRPDKRDSRSCSPPASLSPAVSPAVSDSLSFHSSPENSHLHYVQ